MKTGKVSRLEDGPSQGLCDTHVNSFLTHLRSKGYAERTLRKKRSISASFAQWTVGKQLVLHSANNMIYIDPSIGRGSQWGKRSRLN